MCVKNVCDKHVQKTCAKMCVKNVWDGGEATKVKFSTPLYLFMQPYTQN